MKFLFFLFFFYSVNAIGQADFEKAERYFNQKQFALAKPLFESVLKDNPNHLKTIEYLGDIQGSFKNWDNAIFYYSKLKSIKPSEANYYYKYGGALGMKAKNSNKFKALSMISDIKSAFEKAIKLNSNHIEARWALIELYIQLPGIVGGSESKAKAYANELMIISKIDGYLAKGHIEAYFKRYTIAEDYYRKAFDIGHSKTSFDKLYDLYYNKLNDKQRAFKIKQEFENKA